MSTPRDFITDGLKEINVLGEGVDLTAEAGADGLRIFNRLIDQWKAEGRQFYVIIRDEFTLTPNTAFFSVGDGADIDIPRPVKFERVTFQDTSVTPPAEYSLGDLLSEQEWESIPFKEQTSTLPQRAYYGPRFPNGRLRPWPIPTSDTLEWVLYYWDQIPTAAGLTDSYSLPPGYEEYLVLALAERFCGPWGRKFTEDQRRRLTLAKTIVERANLRLPELTFPAEGIFGTGQGWDIRFGP